MKIYLAGTFGERKHIEQMKKSKYVLESFVYFQPWQECLLRSCESFMLDSGAFTFMQKCNSDVDWDDYIERYADFINQHDIELFFELDIDSVIGYERVLKYRDKLEHLTKKKCIPVWHITRGVRDFIETCEGYPYVAIGGLVGKLANSEAQKKLEKLFPSFIKEAHKRESKIHALGFTKVSDLTRYHFDSVDSTRWKCERFGRVEIFDGRTMRPIDRRKNGKRIADTEAAMLFTHGQWLKFQKYADSKL